MKTKNRENLDNFNKHDNNTIEWDYNVEMIHLTEYHKRIIGDNFCIDIWPSSKKYFDFNTKKSSVYENLDDLMNKYQ